MVLREHVDGVQEKSNCKNTASWNDSSSNFLELKALTKHPDVTGRGKPPEVYGFRSHPFDGQFPFRSCKTQYCSQTINTQTCLHCPPEAL